MLPRSAKLGLAFKLCINGKAKPQKQCRPQKIIDKDSATFV